MSQDEDTTRRLPTLEERMIAAIAEMRAEMRVNHAETSRRLTALEEEGAARSRETRPLWDNLILRLSNIERQEQEQTSLLNGIVRDLYATRGRLGALEDKIRERQPAA